MTPREIIALWAALPVEDPNVRAGNLISDLSSGGFVIVPREPTAAMHEAAVDACLRANSLRHTVTWPAMIAAWEKANV